MRNRYLYITLLAILGFSAESQGLAIRQTPRLVVSIQIDQLTSDALENYAPAYGDDGLRRLLNQGLVFKHASYTFEPVDAASASATIATGSTPYYHGITASEWFSREAMRQLDILYDREHKQSPAQLMVSTLGDEMKVTTDGASRVYAFAPTAECAILSAGHAADGAAWIQQGHWKMSSYYAPVDYWLRGFCRDYVPDADTNMSVAKAAVFCIDKTTVGQDDNVDLLSISLTVKPTIDSYLSLDQSLAFIINGITSRIPLERVLFVVTCTGIREEEENDNSNNERFRIPSGKFYTGRTAGLLNMYLGAVYGSAQYIEANYKNQLFLNHKLIESKNINMGDILRQSQEFLLQMAGVRNVYTSHQLMTSDSPKLERIRNGHCVDRSGDLIIEVAPGWKIINEDTKTSYTSRSALAQFPIIFFGNELPAQQVERPVTTEHIAPTVARCIRIRAPNACQAEPLF